MDTTAYLQLYNRLNGARIEGRLETVTQRQKEIQKLYKAIQANEKELVQALGNELGWNHEDGLLELATVLQALRILFEAHDIKKTLAEENLISTAKSTLIRRVPLGNILILAEAGAPVAQSIIPLCLAVVEGNTSLVILSHSTPETSALLLKIINENTDEDAIIAIKPESSSDLTKILTFFGDLAWHGIFIQSPSARAEIQSRKFHQSSPSVRLLCQPASSSTVIVTRKADIRRAASDVALAKFSFYAGRSIAALGFVLVDEFVMDEFLGHLENFIRGLITVRPPDMKVTKHVLRPETGRALNHVLSGACGKGARAIQISPDSSGETLLVGPSLWFKENFLHLQRDGATQKLGYSDPVLAIQPTTSMEAAIKITNELNEDSSPASVYLFGNSNEVRYLSLFTIPTFKYINRIPLDTCLSPYPASRISALSPFLAQTHLIHPASDFLGYKSSRRLQESIESGKGNIEALKELLGQELQPPAQKSGFQVGFFPQGGLVGLSHVVLLLGLSLTGILWGVKKAFKS